MCYYVYIKKSGAIYIKYSTILWDFNGTIIDDVKASLFSVNDMLEKRNMPLITLDDYYSFVGTPISKFYENIFDLSKISFEIIANEFAQGYNKHLQKSPLMNGVKELILRFNKEKKIQAIVSSAHIESISGMLLQLGLKDYFSSVLGHSDYNASDKTALAADFLRKNDINPKDCVLIGDTLHDYEVAQNIGVECILTTCGHQSRWELSAATKAIIVDSMLEVSDIIK